jgi:hypothetical protein
MRTKARHYYPPIKKCRGSTLRQWSSCARVFFAVHRGDGGRADATTAFGEAIGVVACMPRGQLILVCTHPGSFAWCRVPGGAGESS